MKIGISCKENLDRFQILNWVTFLLILEEYQHSPEEIDKLILKTQKALDEAKTNKENLISKKDGVGFDYKKTEDYVNRIKKLKGNYCREYELYEKMAKDTKLKVVQYREEVNYSIKMQNLYSEEINKLRNLEIAFENLRMQILNRMK